MTSKLQQRIETVENGALAKGKKELLAHLYDERLTARQAIAAKCYDCMCFFVDGRRDCEMKLCALYPFMTYNKNKRKARVVSEEQKNAVRERFKNARISRGAIQQATTSKIKGQGAITHASK